MAEIGNIDVIQTELGISAEWRIKNFFSSLKIDHAFYWSPPFSYAGHTWELWICRYGYKLGKSFIELCLKRRSTGPPICQEFSVALKTRNGQKDFERHFTDVFKEKNDFLSPHCISKSELLRRRRELVPSEVLTVVCTLKSPLYAGTASKSYVFDLEIHAMQCIYLSDEY